MAVKVGINGFGRIGRNIMRAALGDKDIDFVAVNDLTNAATLAHLLKYDSVLGNLHADGRGDGRRHRGRRRRVQGARRCKDPAQLPWKDLGVDVVFESHRPLHQARRRGQAPRRRREEGRSSPRRPRGPTSPSCWASTTRSTTRRSTRSSRTRRARPTAWRRSPRCCTRRSASRRAG